MLDSARLKANLFKENIHQYELANQLGVTETYLSKVLRGRVKPSKELVAKISKTLKRR